MIAITVTALILGGIVGGLAHSSALFWIVSIICFICGLPFALIFGYIDSKVEYHEACEDYRLAEKEYNDAVRDSINGYPNDIDPKASKKHSRSIHQTNIYIDNRQVHYHNTFNVNHPRDSKGRFISNK